MRNFTIDRSDTRTGKAKRWLGLLTFCMMLLMGQQSVAQINYSESFPSNAGGWTKTGGYNSGDFLAHWWDQNYCTAAGAIRLNVYSSIPNGTLTSPAVGTSNGGPITLNYQYKILDYAGTTTSDATAANFGYFRVQYAASLDGPWTTVQTVGTQAPGGVGEAHTPSQSCTPKTVNFLPAAGPMYIRFEITRTNGDWVIYFDDIEMTQGTPPPMCTTPDDVTSLNLTST